MPVITVTDATFSDDVLASPTPVLVDFWAPWCTPCRIQNVVLAELAKELADQFTLAQFNTQENPAAIPQAYQVVSIPTLILFHHGVTQNIWVGARPKLSLRADLIAALAICLK
jgi:thioredoxin 1